MNIHEIIHAWENSALPEGLAALAAIESKVDEYADAASAGEQLASTVLVKSYYNARGGVYNLIKHVVQKRIEAALPDLVNMKAEIVERKGGVSDEN